MKITNLIEAPYATNHVTAKVDDAQSQSDRLISLSKNKIGSGRTAIVVGDEKDPHMVDRYAKNYSYDKADGEYDIFANWIISNEEVRSNPHFPRIYSVESNEKREDEWRTKIYRNYKIEKLIPMDKLSSEEIRAIMDTHFAPRDMSVEEYNDYDFTYTDIAIFTFEYIHSGESSEDIAPVGKFRQACDMLEKFLYDDPKGLIYDLHWENIMVRRTGKGLQLVFTDPIAYN